MAKRKKGGRYSPRKMQRAMKAPVISEAAWNLKRPGSQQVEARLLIDIERGIRMDARKYSWGGHELKAGLAYAKALVKSSGISLVEATVKAKSILNSRQLRAVRWKFALNISALQNELRDHVIIDVPGMSRPWFRPLLANAESYVGQRNKKIA